MNNVPNILTITRLVLIPVFVVLFYWPSTFANLAAALAFLAAALTDLLDGYIARRFNYVTKFGAFLDPVADKIMVCVALVLVVEYFSVKASLYFDKINLLITIPAMIIICREIVVSALREWMAELGKRARVAVGRIGKWKTAIQMVSITGLVWRYDALTIYCSIGLLILATVLTLWSMIGYLITAGSEMLAPGEQAAPAVQNGCGVQDFIADKSR